MEWIDSHCHLDFLAFRDDLDQVLTRARDRGVQQFLVPGVSVQNWTEVLALAKKYPIIHPALGLHPAFLTGYDATHLLQLEQQVSCSAGVVAIGEIGLDKCVDYDFNDQKQICWQQLMLAKQFDLPVILHCRKAHNELLVMLAKAQIPRAGVIHGFSGSVEMAKQYMKLGYKLGIGGVISYPRAQKTRATVAQLPLDALLLETDSPDMPVYGRQGQRNTPSAIPDIFNVLTELRVEQPEQISRVLADNFRQLFRV